MFKATKVRLYPTAEQRRLLTNQFGAMRWVYNHMLHWRMEAWRERRECVTQRMTLDRLVELKAVKATEWLKDADSQALQQSVMHLDRAYQRFFQGLSRYPRFKNKQGKQSMSYPQRVKVIDDRALYLPKVGVVRAVLHRELVGRIKTVTVSHTTTGKYYASILCDDGQPLPDPVKTLTEDNVMGLDMGLAHLVITSTGEKQDNPRYLKRADRNLRCKQKSLSRKKIGSNNRDRARLLVAKAHEQVANARNDFQHKLSRRLIDENQAICVETLKVNNMLKNRRLSQAIADASWGELIRKLEYKARWEGKHLVRIDPWYPSTKTCSHCGSTIDQLPLSERQWTCPTCGAEHDRDMNASLNVKQQGILKLKAEGLSVSACGGMRQTGSTLVRSAVACEARSPILQGGE